MQQNELLGGMTVKVGRQRFNNEREWLYDEKLDGVRVLCSYADFLLDLSVSEQNDPELLHGEDDERVSHYVLHARYSPDEDTEVGIYSFVQNDRKDAQEDPWFFGFHAHGEVFDDLEYWLEVAHVRSSVSPAARCTRNSRKYGIACPDSRRKSKS